MSENINQIYIANPATVMDANDLFYLGRSPYNATDDFAILWSNVLASIVAQIQSGMNWVDVTGTTQAMVTNTGYVVDNASLITFTLPATSAFGDCLKVIGFNSGGWQINVGLAQTIHLGNEGVTPSTGHIASTNLYDCVTLRCVVPDAEWIVESNIGNITVA